MTVGVIIGITITAVYFLGTPNSDVHTYAKDDSDVYPKTTNPNPQKRSYTIIAQDAEIEVSADSTVTWANDDIVMYTVTSDNNFDSGFIQTGQQWSYAFEEHGLYE